MEIVNAAFAPVNIAWIKYMGKEDGRPTNSSLSMTLKNIGTFVRFTVPTGARFGLNSPDGVALHFEKGSYIPPLSGQEKLKKFLSRQEIWRRALEPFGFQLQFPNEVNLMTQNNAPAATGIATSASSFAAITLAWAACLVGTAVQEFKKALKSNPDLKLALAQVASLGSGSACRSFDGPWVEWDPDAGIRTQSFTGTEWVDLILLIDQNSKAVSSTEAHARVKSSPLWIGRPGRVENRLGILKNLMKESANLRFEEIQKLVWEESEDMHSLFHTSSPPFFYQTEKSRSISEGILRGKGPSRNVVLTMDAGANLHLFTPRSEQKLWVEFLDQTFPEIPVIIGEQGAGADYVDEQFKI